MSTMHCGMHKLEVNLMHYINYTQPLVKNTSGTALAHYVMYAAFYTAALVHICMYTVHIVTTLGCMVYSCTVKVQ